MVQVCTRCHRANPPQALYCHFDGLALSNGLGLAALLPREFVFRSGRICRSIDELTLGCHQEWTEARTLLRQGELHRFLQDAGRHDLARLATESTEQPDPDLALYQFLGGMPPVREPDHLPLLDYGPRRVHLPGLRRGQQQAVTITLANQRQGILLGRVAVADDCAWLRLEGSAKGQECPVKAEREQVLTLLVDASSLSAEQTYSGSLKIVTNGGVGEIVVRVDVEAITFTREPLEGAANQRELALKMRSNPRTAAPALEDGSVARWFEANGWNYPISGPTARGIGSVQQFFEALGLARPPMLTLSQSEVRFEAVNDEPLSGSVALRTPSKKWVYATVDSDVDWLQPLSPMVSGPLQATIGFKIDPKDLGDGENNGQLQLKANGGLPMSVRVVVSRRRKRPAKAVVVKSPTPESDKKEDLWRYLTRAIVVAALLRLLLLPADLYARTWMATTDGPTPGSMAFWRASPLALDESGFLRGFIAATAWLGGAGGVVRAWRQGGRGRDYGYALCAGVGAGVVLAATLACVLDLLDAVPRAILGLMPETTPGVVATAVWLVVALGLWASLGALTGVMTWPRAGKKS